MHTGVIKDFVDKTWKQIESILRRKGFETILLDSEKSLRKFIYDTIPDNCIVALSNSLTVKALKIKDILIEKGNRIYYSWSGNNSNRSLDTFEDHARPDFYLTLTDSISLDGVIKSNELTNCFSTVTPLPNKIIAFSAPQNIATDDKKSPAQKELLNFDSRITIVMVPFLKVS